MTTRRFSGLGVLALMLALALALIGCSAPSTAPVTPPTTVAPAATSTPQGAEKNAGHTVVKMTNTTFSPVTVTVKVGDRVVWENSDKAVHRIVFDDGSVTSADIGPGNVAGHKFTKAGTYSYHCMYHPQMIGTVIVK